MSLPTPFIRFVPDADADANDVNANFDLITAKFAYGLVDSDFSPAADLDGNKLSSSPAKQVSESKLLTNAVSSRVLASHGSVDASRAVGTDHLQDHCVTAAKLASGVGRGLLVTKAFSLGYTTIWGASPYVWALSSGLIVPDVNYAVATYDVVGVYLYGLSVPGTMYSASAWADGALTNWRAGVAIGSSSGGTFSGTVALILQAK
jgi:hypothetical protein